MDHRSWGRTASSGDAPATPVAGRGHALKYFPREPSFRTQESTRVGRLLGPNYRPACSDIFGCRMRIAIIFGTRPEAIKMAPVVHELRSTTGGTDEVETLVFVTAQHRAMLDQVLSLFEIEVDADLNAMRPGQGLA